MWRRTSSYSHSHVPKDRVTIGENHIEELTKGHGHLELGPVGFQPRTRSPFERQHQPFSAFPSVIYNHRQIPIQNEKLTRTDTLWTLSIVYKPQL